MLSSTGDSLRIFLAVGHFNPTLKFSQEPWRTSGVMKLKKSGSSSLGQARYKRGYHLGDAQFGMPFPASCFW